MLSQGRALSVAVVILALAACSKEEAPRPWPDGSSADCAAAPLDGPPDAPAAARSCASGPADAGGLELGARAPELGQALEGGAREAAADQRQIIDPVSVDAGADLGGGGDAAELCPPGFELAGGNPDGGGLACTPPGAPTFPCTRPRDGWCPTYCPITTICSAAGWLCCSRP